MMNESYDELIFGIKKYENSKKITETCTLLITFSINWFKSSGVRACSTMTFSRAFMVLLYVGHLMGL